jgi:hypothetical protein
MHRSERSRLRSAAQHCGLALLSLFRATTVTGNGRTVEAVPIDRVRAVLSDYGIETQPGRSAPD